MRNYLIVACGTLFLTASTVITLKNGGCTDDDIPSGRSPFYDHSSVIAPYKDESQISFDDTYKSLMKTRLDQFIQITESNAPPSKEFVLDPFPMNWVFYGSSGRALTFWKLYMNNVGRDDMKAKAYLQKAKEYIDGSLSRMRYDRDDAVGFLEGNPGVYAIASVIYDSIGSHKYAESFIQQVAQVFKRPLTNQVDFDRGMAGLLYTVEFLEGYYGKQLFPRKDVLKVAHAIIEYGFQNKLENGTLVFPEPPPDGRITIGLGRGSGGIAIRLLRIPELHSNETIMHHLQLTVDYLLARQMPSGHVVDNQPGMQDRVQWCHGAPNAIPVFIEAFKVYKDQKYLDAANIGADYTFKYGVLTKGMGLCHGTSSNIYLIAQLYALTKDPKLKYYITEMHKFALNTPTLTDPEQLENYDCLGMYAAFHDSVTSIIATYSDFLLHVDGNLGEMWMLGFGDIPLKKSSINQFLTE